MTDKPLLNSTTAFVFLSFRLSNQLARISPLEGAFNIFRVSTIYLDRPNHFSLIIFVCACIANIYIIIYPYLSSNLNDNSLLSIIQPKIQSFLRTEFVRPSGPNINSGKLSCPRIVAQADVQKCVLQWNCFVQCLILVLKCSKTTERNGKIRNTDLIFCISIRHKCYWWLRECLRGLCKENWRKLCINKVPAVCATRERRLIVTGARY